MALQFLGGETGKTGSPRLYQDGGDFLVQGYTVTDPEILDQLAIPVGETVVRVPRSLWRYLPGDAHGGD
jgi:hypothetical protein